MLGVLGEIGSATPAVSTVVEWRRMGKMPLVFPIRRCGWLFLVDGERGLYFLLAHVRLGHEPHNRSDLLYSLRTAEVGETQWGERAD